MEFSQYSLEIKKHSVFEQKWNNSLEIWIKITLVLEKKTGKLHRIYSKLKNNHLKFFTKNTKKFTKNSLQISEFTQNSTIIYTKFTQVSQEILKKFAQNFK